MKRLSMPIVSVLVALAAGCGVGPHVDDYNESLVAAALASCSCGNGGYSSEEECREEAPPDAGEQACVEALFKNAEANYEAQLDCRTAVQNRLASCLNDKTCTDLARLGCAGEALEDEADCPDLPNDINNELRQCLD
ncbi:hypothetical protein OV203_38415 [Nannocystis sp. ILAH1]|uniref:hypothetical protein n=1 Tax=unclassified Nannocystis TaxID=2627009 RepID=UPI00226D4840|nr:MULTISPECIES: hypothetical protein [unclassified Nannocystis]MCY0993080.1 hypothetical protein [Nannocystis sp. ILAH1]MCY1066085.1 hypothetical protein [Nannocystis sp. RBIL2]